VNENNEQVTELRAFQAKWLVPVITPPIENGVIVLNGDKIQEVGNRSLLAQYDLAPTDLGEVIIFPGLINCHTHLEQSVPTSLPQDFVQYQRQILQNRFNDNLEQQANAARSNLQEAVRFGTVALADFSQEGASYNALLESSVFARLFFEVVGFKSSNADAIMRHFVEKTRDAVGERRLTKHLAPSSVWGLSTNLLREISLNERHIAIHMNCSEHEEEFISSGRGFIKQLLMAQSDYDYSWQVPACSPVEYFFNSHFYAKHNILVHMLTTTPDEIDFIRDFGVKVNICLCPRAAERLSAARPPVMLFMEKGFNLCLGTEGKSLVSELDLRQEMRRCVDNFGVSPENALKFATLNGAYAIGFHKEVGSLEPGKTSRCLVLECPASTSVDPYEAIVFSPQAPRWLI